MQDDSSSPSPGDPGTFDFFIALDDYQSAASRFLETWLDVDAYADFRCRIDAIREHASTHPALTVLSLQLVIAHLELVSALWQQSSVGVADLKLQQVKKRHTLAVETLRTAATALLRAE